MADWLRVEPRALARQQDASKQSGAAEDTSARGGYKRGFRAHRKILSYGLSMSRSPGPVLSRTRASGERE
jgi:hypothetical protein